MSDAQPKSRGGFAWRIRQWIGGQLVQEVPDDLAVCEYDCKSLDCTQGRWETCERRLKAPLPDK